MLFWEKQQRWGKWRSRKRGAQQFGGKGRTRKQGKEIELHHNMRLKIVIQISTLGERGLLQLLRKYTRRIYWQVTQTFFYVSFFGHKSTHSRKVRRISSQQSSPASSRRTSRLNNILYLIISYIIMICYMIYYKAFKWQTDTYGQIYVSILWWACKDGNPTFWWASNILQRQKESNIKTGVAKDKQNNPFRVIINPCNSRSRSNSEVQAAHLLQVFLAITNHLD